MKNKTKRHNHGQQYTFYYSLLTTYSYHYYVIILSLLGYILFSTALFAFFCVFWQSNINKIIYIHSLIIFLKAVLIKFHTVQVQFCKCQHLVKHLPIAQGKL